MGILKVKGIVIAENNMSDYDKMVTILTPNRQNWVCCQRSKKTKKSAYGSNTIFMLWGLPNLSRGKFLSY